MASRSTAGAARAGPHGASRKGLLRFSRIKIRVMRTAPPNLLPLFRSEMQLEMLGLLLLQPDASWALGDLARRLKAPQSSVHRELQRAVDAGIVVRDSSHRPHRYR